MKKRGVSKIIVAILLILMCLVFLFIVWSLLKKLIAKELEKEEIKGKLANEDMYIDEVNTEDPSNFAITLSRGEGEEYFIGLNKTPVNYTVINVTYENITVWDTVTETKSGTTCDIVFLIDSTQSMSGEIADVKNIIKNFTDNLSKSSIDWRLGLINFRDYRTAPCGCGCSNDYAYNLHFFYDFLILGGSSGLNWATGTLINITRTSNNCIVLTQDPNLDIPIPDAIVLNQYQTTSARNTTMIYGDNITAQTFIPSLSGNLTNLTIRVSKYGSPGSIVVEIRNSSGSMPGSAILATAERNDITSLQNYMFNFATPPYLINGQRYTIIIKVKNNGGDPINYYNISYASEVWNPPSGSGQNYVPGTWSGDLYTRGMYCNSKDNEITWTCFNSCTNSSLEIPPCNRSDIYFATYMFRKGYLTKGYFRSGEANNTYDAGRVFDWYTFNISRSLPGGTSINISFRSSNDLANWSPWFDYGSSISGSLTNVPDGRYLQQKSVLTSNGANYPTICSTTILSNREIFTTNVTKYIEGLPGYTGGLNTVNVTSPSGGNDSRFVEDPEAHLTAINASLFMPWRTFNITKFDILLSDSPPHATDCVKRNIITGAPDNTDIPCYLGPKSVLGVTNDLVYNNITFFYINQQSGLCDNRIMADNMTSLTGGGYYEYTKAGGVQDIILKVGESISKTTMTSRNITHSVPRTIQVQKNITIQQYGSGVSYNYLKVMFYNETNSYTGRINASELPAPLESKTYSFNLTGKITNVKRIEIYPVVVLDSGEEVIGNRLSVWYAP